LVHNSVNENATDVTSINERATRFITIYTCSFEQVIHRFNTTVWIVEVTWTLMMLQIISVGWNK